MFFSGAFCDLFRTVLKRLKISSIFLHYFRPFSCLSKEILCYFHTVFSLFLAIFVQYLDLFLAQFCFFTASGISLPEFRVLNPFFLGIYKKRILSPGRYVNLLSRGPQEILRSISRKRELLPIYPSMVLGTFVTK